MSSLDELAKELRSAAAASPAFPEDRFDGRGIVICAGGARLFTCAWVTIGLLRRHLGSTLPIEVWYLGPGELGPPMRGLLAEWGVQPIDAHEVAKRQQVDRLGGWELKPFAVMHSRFREVLLLDADNVAIREPSFLFEHREYVATGAVFWPDIARLAADNDIWAVSGLAYRDMPSLESGQMVVDKARCWAALRLTHWINQHSDAFYRFLYGDKDTFLIAWLMLGQPFHLVRHAPKLLHATICQRDPDGAALFQHRNGAKWIIDGSNPRVPGFRWEDECRVLLHELSEVWDGRIFNPPERSVSARDLERDLALRRSYLRRRLTSDERRIALLGDHRIAGGGPSECYWYVADGADGPELRIEGKGLQLCTLRAATADGVWRGRLLQPPEMPVELIPADESGGGRGADLGNQVSKAAALLDAILELAERLPWDRETARDVVGALRIVAALDPAIADGLIAQADCAVPESRRAQAAQAALEGLGRHRADRGGIAPGHGWTNADFRLERGYTR